MRKHIVYSRLNDNRIIGMAVYKLKSIPHFLLLGDNQFESILYDNKKVFSDLLSEFHQLTNYTDACIELDWLNEAQNTTALQSNISIYLIIRLTDYTLENIQNKFDEIDKIVHLNLDFQKYNIELSDYPFESYFSMNLEINQMWAIRKKENILFMQNGLINQVYEFDMINDVANELDSLVNFFLNNNKAIFSLQLIPVRLYNEEYAFLEQITNNLSNLLNGISVPKYGLIRDPLVEKPLSVYKTYLNNNAGFYVMNAVVLGRNGLVNNLSSRVMLEFARKNNEGYSPRMDITLVNNGCSDMANYPFIYPWVISEKIMASNRILTFDKYNNFLYRLTSFITPLEASTLFRLPIGTKKITAGFDIIEIEKRSKNYASNILEEADIVLGELQNVVGSNANIGFKLKDLTKHMLVVGTPGSGKSTFVVSLMDRLWKDHKIPFLVFEPAKTEYRSLLDSIPDLQVFSPGKNNVAPYILNPFIPPKKVPLEVYKSIVKSAFSVAFEMWTPLDQLFDETLNICYSNFGWLDETTIDDGLRCFSLSDFIETYKQVVSSKSYTGEYKKQIEAAGVMRLNGLLEQNLNVFDNENTVSIKDILTKPTVIELSNIKDIRQKSFIIALLLNNIYAYVEANLGNDGKLKNVILLEEAHVLLNGDNVASGESSNANQAAVKLLSNMLAEIRSRGVGIVIADQSPRKVSSEVIANTNLKIMFRLVEAVDKKIVMDSTTMTELQFDRLARLKTGQALVYFDKLEDVEEVKFKDYRLENNISIDLSDEAVKRLMNYWDDKQHILIPYEECHYLNECKSRCDFNCRSKSRVIADRLFRKHVNNIRKLDDFKQLYLKINVLIKEEIDEVFGPELLDSLKNCVKVHFLRKVRFNSSIGLTKKICINTIKSLNK